MTILRRSLKAKGLKGGVGIKRQVWDVGERSGPAFKTLVGKPAMKSSLLRLRHSNNVDAEEVKRFSVYKINVDQWLAITNTVIVFPVP
jgi:hypothetical protein